MDYFLWNHCSRMCILASGEGGLMLQSVAAKMPVLNDQLWAVEKSSSSSLQVERSVNNPSPWNVLCYGILPTREWSGWSGRNLAWNFARLQSPSGRPNDSTAADTLYNGCVQCLYIWFGYSTCCHESRIAL
jgi:hypothetical protein